MRSAVATCALLLLASCSAPPNPVAAPSAPVSAPRSAPERGAETVYVNASALNVRERASTDAAVVGQVMRGASLTVVSRNDGWVQVRLGDARLGWVAERFVSAEPVVAEQQRTGGRAARATVATGGKRGCESDYSFIETPTLSRGSEADAHGLVVVEATVSAKGIVTATKVISNTTGDPSAGAAAEREIRSARFAPPMRNCEPRSFIFTYRRTF